MKSHLTLSIDDELVKRIKKENINISEQFENLFWQFLNQEKPSELINEKMTAKAELIRIKNEELLEEIKLFWQSPIGLKVIRDNLSNGNIKYLEEEKGK